MKEHQLILSTIELMERYAASDLEAQDRSVLFEKFQDFINFIQNFADKFHHAKEEDVLFKYMESGGALTHCNPLPQMLFEHEQGREYVQNMKSALAADDLNALVRSSQNYGMLLKEHIFKEENILYPMAENGISDEDKKLMRAEYETVEEKLDAPSIWNKYEATVENLKDYLK